MRNPHADIKSHIAGVGITMVQCWRIRPKRNLNVIGITKHTRNLTINSVTFTGRAGVSDASIEASESFTPDNYEVTAFLPSGTITEADIHARVYARALVEVFLVNYLDTSQEFLLHRGEVGKIDRQDGLYTFEVKGLANALTHKIGGIIQAKCPAVLGDQEQINPTFSCGLNLYDIDKQASFTYVASTKSISAPNFSWGGQGYMAGKALLISGTVSNNGTYTIDTVSNTPGGNLTVLEALTDEGPVTSSAKQLTGWRQSATIATVDSVEPRRKFTTSTINDPVTATARPDQWFQYGNIEWLTGNNAGVKIDIDSQMGVNIVLDEEVPLTITVGDSVLLTAGCDHQPATCKTKFNNFVNFQGFPFLSTTEELHHSPIRTT